jgi:hypothetical protein
VLTAALVPCTVFPNRKEIIMPLKISTELTHYVEYHDLDAFIAQIYGFEYTVTAAEECGNDTSLSFNVDGSIQPWDEEDFAKLKNHDWVPYRTGMILNFLARDKHIPTGMYVVNVSW